MAQVLPKDEDFAAPDWLNPGAGTANALPWYFWYLGFKPSEGVSAGTYPTYPYGFAAAGAYEKRLETYGRQELFIPKGSPRALMTDETGTGHEFQRGVLCREEDSVAVEDIDFKVVFGLAPVTGSSMGSSHSGVDGASSTAGGQWSLPPTKAGATDIDLIDMGEGSQGNWSSGRAPTGPSTDTDDFWAVWLGNSLFFRAGGGNPLVTDPDAASPPATPRNNWNCSHVDHYAFCAYPVINTGVGVDLYLELWQVKFSGGGATDGTPRQLIKQVVDNGANQIDFSLPYFLRVTCDNDGTPDPHINAYIGPYKQGTLPNLAEAQCFKDGVFGNNTYTVGSGVTHTSATGNVKDANADKITAFADKTFGWGMGRDRSINIAPRLNNDASHAGVQIANVVESVYSVEIKDISAGTVLYRDEFSRCVGLSGLGTQSITAKITNFFGDWGPQANGMFTWDGYSNYYGALGLQIRRLLLWTDSQTDTTAANDFVTLDFNGTGGPPGDIYATDVIRQCVYHRPSTQFYNHHRSIDFKPGAEDNAAASFNAYEMGISLRGWNDGSSMSSLVCYLYWITALDDTPTVAQVTIVERTTTFSKAWSSVSETKIASRDWDASPTGTAHDIADFNSTYNIYDGNFHTLDFRAETYPEATSPSAAAVYHVTLDGAPLELDSDVATLLQSSTVSPFAVTHPGPAYPNGQQEGFHFASSLAEYSGSTQQFVPMKFKNWVEGALTADPVSDDPDSQASIPVSGEGTAVGSLNAVSGALAISGGGVWDVEVTVTTDSSQPIYRVPFASGHTYTSPATSKPRRRWRVTVKAADLTLFQSLQAFFNSHNGPEIPFEFVVPVPLTETTKETVTGWFGEDTLQSREIGPQVYDISFTVEERLVA